MIASRSAMNRNNIVLKLKKYIFRTIKNFHYISDTVKCKCILYTYQCIRSCSFHPFDFPLSAVDIQYFRALHCKWYPTTYKSVNAWFVFLIRIWHAHAITRKFCRFVYRLTPLTTPPVEKSTMMNLSLQEIILIGNASEQVGQKINNRSIIKLPLWLYTNYYNSIFINLYKINNNRTLMGRYCRSSSAKWL